MLSVDVVRLTVIFDWRIANGKIRIRISREMLVELAAVLSFTIAEVFRNCTWNTEWICACVGGRGGCQIKRGNMRSEASKSHHLQI